MKMTKLFKFLSLSFCMLLIAATVVFTSGCSDKKNEENSSIPQTISSEQQITYKTLGTGKTEFTFIAQDTNGEKAYFKILTDKKTVADALLEHKLISGDDGDYGLYVKTVNGVTVDYAVDGKFWAFYVDGKSSANGVSLTDVKAGAEYMFKVE